MDRTPSEVDLGALEDLSKQSITSGCRLAEVEIRDTIRDVVEVLNEQICIT